MGCPTTFHFSNARSMHGMQLCLHPGRSSCTRLTDTPGLSCGAAEVLLFALVANTSIASLNLSLLVNSVGFYQASHHRVLKSVRAMLQHSIVALQLMSQCQSCNSTTAVQCECRAGPAALIMPARGRSCSQQQNKVTQQ